MSTIVDKVKNNYKNLIAITVFILLLPLISVVMHIIMTYGTLVGSYARTVIEHGLCM